MADQLLESPHNLDMPMFIFTSWLQADGSFSTPHKNAILLPISYNDYMLLPGISMPWEV